jgi:hypothetical protein
VREISTKKGLSKMAYSEKIKKEAYQLFMIGKSYEEISNQLKSTFKKETKKMHRSTIEKWASAGAWIEDKAEIAKKALRKAKSKKPEEKPKEENFAELLSKYHADSYEMDSELRLLAHEKLKTYFETAECEVLTVKQFLEIFKISTMNIIKLHEIAKGREPVDELLDDLLKMRGQI